ncbi:hypothetical protein SAMD00023353_9800020 [Rosellinia necatrix]|uniref:Uncharacterized protein n=1 Tax=Rosellinia necatrix TaxID=77044 RepID=A0A1W2TUG5_ROSNE|nr:hypothetical protein SAMD00023353_9800020 [Rosellinia necatrix]
MAGTNYGNRPTHGSRPYRSLPLLDDEGADDDVCVWRDGPDPDDSHDGSDEPLSERLQRLGIRSGREKRDHRMKEPKRTERAERAERAETASSTETETSHYTGLAPPASIDPDTGRLTKEAFREREIQYALSTTRRNLTHISQFMLKLEARAGTTTKEGIRQTLDATVQDLHYDFDTCGADGGAPDADHKSEIEEIRHLSEELYDRLHLIDRYWRRASREARDAEGRTPKIEILGERDIRDWIKVELGSNHLATEDACYYTIEDLVSGRTFWSWGTYLQESCQFGDHPSEQAKLVALAWRFLDRNLRGPRPANPTTFEQFIAELDARRKTGAWDELRQNPKKQEADDAKAWQAMRYYWSSRTAPG